MQIGIDCWMVALAFSAGAFAVGIVVGRAMGMRSLACANAAIDGVDTLMQMARNSFERDDERAHALVVDALDLLDRYHGRLIYRSGQ